jgi:hypothetical protein
MGDPEMKMQEFNNIRVDLVLLENELRGFFSRENFGDDFSTEVINESINGRDRSGFTLKARWRWLKFSFVFRVRVACQRTKVIVEIAEERQRFKVGIATVGGLALATGGLGLLVAPVAAGMGGTAAYRSKKVVDGAWKVIDGYMAEASREIVDADHPAE